MATRPKVPNQSVPFLLSDGRVTPEWYRFLSQLPTVGEAATSATGGSATALPAQPVGYETFVLNGEQKKRAYYDP